jgi:hypothetical protein
MTNAELAAQYEVTPRTMRRWRAAGWRPGMPQPVKGPARIDGGHADRLENRMRERLQVVRAMRSLGSATTSDVVQSVGASIERAKVVRYLIGLRAAGSLRSYRIHGIMVWEVRDGA